ncbi:MAG: hypothetical protein M0D55_15375 [Elusimicrobiota bacterium]|nr:MAG: hypothetical protein M0D55_15375 [Elusimicrobiota bacterium]
MRLIGPAVENHRLSVDDFERLIHNIQLVVKRLGQRIAGQEGKRQGRIAKDIESSCSLDIVAIKAGSLEVQFGLPKPQTQPHLFGDIGVNAIESLLDGMSMIDKNSDGWPKDFDPSVTDPMLEVGRILNHGVNEIEFKYAGTKRGQRKVRYTSKLRTRIEKRIETASPEELIIYGFLLEVDFKDKTAEIHEPLGNVIRISFESVLEDVILSGARKQVKVIGIGERDRAGKVGRVRAQHLEIVESLESDLIAESQLVLDQGITGTDPFVNATPLKNISALFSGSPDTRDPDVILRDLRMLRKPRNLDS